MTRLTLTTTARLAPLLAISAAMAAPAAAQEAPAAPLSLEHRMLVRCSAAFALVAHRQLLGEEWALGTRRSNNAGASISCAHRRR